MRKGKIDWLDKLKGIGVVVDIKSGKEYFLNSLYAEKCAYEWFKFKSDSMVLFEINKKGLIKKITTH